MTFELIVRNGTVVTPSTEGAADVGVAGGRVTALGEPGTLEAGAGTVEIDATDRFVLPGGVDPHVHLTPAGSDPTSWRWCDDFAAGTAAALAGGVTTVGNMSHPGRGEGVIDAIARDAADGERAARCDFFLHPILMEPSPAEIEALRRLAHQGHTSVKIFLSFRRFDRNVEGYLEALRAAAASGTIAMLHCEDAAIMECCCSVLREQGRVSAEYFPEARPVVAERSSTERAIAFAEVSGAIVYVVHLAAGAALQRCQEAQARALPVYVETRPLYLHLTRELFAEPDGAKYYGAPPLRESSDVDALWAGIANGSVATLATDHAPWPLADKLDPATDATTARLGVSDLETSLPMLWSAGVHTGRISKQRFVEVISTNAAKLFGLFPRKGTIAVGSDADLVLWDPTASWTVDGASSYSNAGYSPYDGTLVHGRPDVVISRGEVVVHAAKLTDAARAGRGQLLARTAARRL